MYWVQMRWGHLWEIIFLKRHRRCGRQEWGKTWVKQLCRYQGQWRSTKRFRCRNSPPQSIVIPHKSILKDSSLWERPPQEQSVKNWIPQEGLHPEEGENFPQIKTVLPMMVTGKKSSHLSLNPQAFPFYFLPLCSWGGGMRERVGGYLTTNQGQPNTACSGHGYLNPKCSLWHESMSPVCIFSP